MQEIELIGLSIILITLIVSYQGIKNSSFFDKYSFQVDKILKEKDYKRFITSSFLHVSWMHLLFNMMAFYSFSEGLGMMVGGLRLLLIYVGSIIGGDLFSLYIHRNHPDYTSAGASGGICGLMFASIGLFPDMQIGIFMTPFSLPGWAYGFLFVLISIYGIKSQRGNIGHEAHLGGGVIGLIIALIMVPESFINNMVPILFILVPTLVFIYYIIARPGFLLFPNWEDQGLLTKEDKYNAAKRAKEKEIDRLLDKINKKGMDQLSEKEKERLKQLSE
ncbi:rhomboid family intramembrane serine protease [Cytophagaceae bacterium YF14B1]|uniref:Rhomboid family intramembrane serine protease n=1 Tax=Xanthocytophaga flava TaxID=3048013 RepID=A0AAE3QYI2_9BACT|nr:rhomboid family intramembrane serine protease [Xanthocytophaga flavus]MDJ1467215.1 rhomboid family intramembrane serine protease [Xanthocytophaga flavus]MDJ1485515.1 rhomboid family intramembrane serine protease [Xanthocytophaga flavus]